MRITITSDRFVVFDREFVEQEHPRKQGQFVKKGSGSSEPTQGKQAHLERAHAEREVWPEHIKALKLPPAWTDVRVSKDPDADLLATGLDAKGRKQYVYAKRFADSQSAVKFSRISELTTKFGAISKQNNANRTSNDQGVKDHADCSALIMSMGIRPGSDEDTKAAEKAYGATTLEGKHVVAAGDGVRLKFIGKKGVALDLPVTDPSLATMLAARAKASGPDGKLFGKVSASTLLDYVHGFDGGGFKTKDFRTLLATKTANDLVNLLPPPKTEAEYKRKVREVAKVVSEKLGNTPTVALQSYINPTVFGSWRQHAATA